MYMQKSAFYCFKTCADSQAPFSGIADARRRAGREPHMPIWRFCGSSPHTQGGGGLSKSTLLIILGTLTRPQCAGITPDPVRIACIQSVSTLSVCEQAKHVNKLSIS